ncbi:MAG: hypothetical protein AAF573_06500 [Bacteroidota bacterium]
MNFDDETMRLLQEEMERQMNELNILPVEKIDNLSPMDLEYLLYDTFGEDSPVAFKANIADDILDDIPFLKLCEAYFEILQQHGALKLTARGNLPRKVCLDLYDRGIIKEDFIESGLMTLRKESDSVVLQNVKLISDMAGITKKRNNKMSLTKKGEQLLQPKNRQRLLEALFIANARQFNWGFHDGYPQEAGVQMTFGYTLYLLLRYGKTKRSFHFYGEKSITAFKFELDYFDNRFDTPEEGYKKCLWLRTFDRFLNFYGMVDFNPNKGIFDLNIDIKTSRLFDGVFELRPEKFKFKKIGFNA